MPGTVAAVVPGTVSWPRMCCRSRGMSYFSERYRTRRAEERYIASVYQASGSARKPSCSSPIDPALTYQLPACQATSFAFTCWAMWPSVERRL
ncbi:hypothetical protein SHIRM173S_01047 [Streptomyces hirsutus]